jgi:hypothetical protein
VVARVFLDVLRYRRSWPEEPLEALAADRDPPDARGVAPPPADLRRPRELATAASQAATSPASVASREMV